MIPIAKPYLTEEDAQIAYDTILSGWVMQGPKVEEFERSFCEYTGAKYAAAVSNCTNALHLSMIVTGIGKGDEVICPSMSFIATANCIKYTGAKPVFAEIESDTYNIDVRHAEKLITEKTKAILIVHQIGMPADIDAFKSLCKKYNLKLIEDAACAAGSSYKGKKIGAHSEIVCFSFHPRKVITTGEGGMITTSNEEYYNRLKLLRQHGMPAKDRIGLGYNYRMTDIQASIGIKQLEKLEMIVEQRRKIALRYIEELKDIDCIRLPVEKEGYISNYQSFSIYIKKNSPVKRDDLIQKLFDEGISTQKGVMTCHREMHLEENEVEKSLPVSEDACDNSLLIPLYAPMDEKDIDKIILNIKTLLK